MTKGNEKQNVFGKVQQATVSKVDQRSCSSKTSLEACIFLLVDAVFGARSEGTIHECAGVREQKCQRTDFVGVAGKRQGEDK